MTMMERVESLLINYPETRVNDNLLLDQVWRADLLNTMTQEEFNVLSYRNFSKLLQEGSLSNPKAVTRARRKVQQDKPHLKEQKVALFRNELAVRYRIMGAQGRIGELL